MERDDRTDLTVMLDAAARGDARAADALLPLVYAELRRLAEHRLATESSAITLQATALVHEAYLRLVDQRRATIRDRGHFFALAAQAIRRVLVDHARARGRMRRGGGVRGAPLQDRTPAPEPETDPADLLALDESLEAFALEHPEKARLVELRYFAGMTTEQAADVLDVTPRTAERWWQFARAWLFRRMEGRSLDG